jgi:hypothetical protein
MATMIPDHINEFETDGERQFYKFLETVAKPDSQYISWYLPDIKGREPDFLLFCDKIGLIIFEVKDWALDQIREADPKYFILDIGSKTEPRKNPFPNIMFVLQLSTSTKTGERFTTIFSP